MKVVIKKSNRRTLSLKVVGVDELLVLAPYGCPNSEINSFIERKASWINKRRFEREKEAELLKNLTNFTQIMYFGTLYRVVFDKNIKKIVSKDGVFYAPIASFDDLKVKFRRFYKKNAQILLEKRLNDLSMSLNLPYNTFKTNVYKAKWGSCSRNNDIKLNSLLIMLNERLIDYVILHELCHIKHFNHSKAFYNFLSKFMPNYKIAIKTLKENGYLLKIFA